MHRVAQQGFARQAALYEAARPSYPPAAVSRVVKIVEEAFKAQKEHSDQRQLEHNQGINSPRVLDLGAGTGKCTRLLAQAAPEWDLLACEPVAEMREQFKAKMPANLGIPIIEGYADNIPLPAQSVDAVIVAQAFHWFDSMASLTEMNRVLKPGAPLILLWNMEDPSKARWVLELRKVYEVYDDSIPQYRKGTWKKVWTEERNASLLSELFSPLPLREEHVAWTMQIEFPMIWGRVLSKSYISVLSEEEKEKCRKHAEKVLEENRSSMVITKQEGKEMVEYPHHTDIFWTYRRSDK